MNIQFLYIDPSVMTYAIQAIAGAVIAIGAVVTLVWRKTRKKVAKKLNLDELGNKETEEDVVLVEEEEE